MYQCQLYSLQKIQYTKDTIVEKNIIHVLMSALFLTKDTIVDKKNT